MIRYKWPTVIHSCLLYNRFGLLDRVFVTSVIMCFQSKFHHWSHFISPSTATVGNFSFIIMNVFIVNPFLLFYHVPKWDRGHKFYFTILNSDIYIIIWYDSSCTKTPHYIYFWGRLCLYYWKASPTFLIFFKKTLFFMYHVFVKYILFFNTKSSLLKQHTVNLKTLENN